MSNITLTEEQNAALAEIKKLNEPIQSLGGFAGTGKTTVISHLIQDKKFSRFAVCAYTGKAANVLRRKGIKEASTIHSLIYEPEKDDDGNLVFVLRPGLGCDGIIVDEASMVGKELYSDLVAFNLPTIFVGDHGQLEPVGEGMNLMAKPDYTLETIHRNAGEIAFFAEFLRKGNRANNWDSTEGKVQFVDKMNVYDHLDQVDQIICAYNRTRVGINKLVRSKLGYTPDYPQVGDRIMCLKNNKQRFLFNGMQGSITSLRRNQIKFLTNSDEELQVRFDPKIFHKEKNDFKNWSKDHPDPFDYAYCATAHKCQGDEFSKVMVLEQQCDLWKHERWTYTAASRAKEQLLWVSNY